MAKAENKKRYVKLGEKAAEGSFYDPTLGLKLVPGKIVELPKNFRTSKRTVKALNGGHLSYVDSDEVEEYFKGNVPTDKDSDSGEITEASLGKMNKPDLKEYILSVDDAYSEEELEDFKKPELLEVALEQFNK